MDTLFIFERIDREGFAALFSPHAKRIFFIGKKIFLLIIFFLLSFSTAHSQAQSMISGVAIMTDTDNTGEHAITYYGGVLFKKVRDESFYSIP